MKENNLPIYTLDIETDPFKYGRKPMPFQIGFFDGVDFKEFWDEKNCIEKMREWLWYRPPGIIYAHNGGRFDVLGYLMEWVINRPMRVINNRLVKCTMECRDGQHEIRDSYSLFPFRLADYKGKSQKKEIEIAKLEKKVRRKHKAEITDYLRMDCVSLHELVSGFIARYGTELTIGTTAMKQLKTFHEFEMLDGKSDDEMRALYFYGGRVDCLQSGVLKGDFKLYDVNSMYPFVMANFDHPIGAGRIVGKDIGEGTYFVSCTGRNFRAFPTRVPGGGLDYRIKYGRFHVSIHEYNMAIKLGLFKVDKIHMTFGFDKVGRFDTFVNTFYEGRKIAKANGDEIEAMCLKYVLNSSYGKFAQSPENYKEYCITRRGENPGGAWTLASMIDMSGEPMHQYMVWTKPSINASRFNVATGASITGAARSVLMEAIAHASNPVYCDTDSLLCEDLECDKDGSRLGAWKLEAEVDTVAIAGKKLYAFWKDEVLVKKAHKGFKITGEDIMKVCMGQEVTSYNDAPTFKLDGECKFIHRVVRMTV